MTANKTEPLSNEILLWNVGSRIPFNYFYISLNLRTGIFRRKVVLGEHPPVSGWYNKRHGRYVMIYRDGTQLYFRLDNDIHPLESLKVDWNESTGMSHVQILANDKEVYKEDYKSPGRVLANNWTPLFEDFFRLLYEEVQDPNKLDKWFRH